MDHWYYAIFLNQDFFFFFFPIKENKKKKCLQILAERRDAVKAV